MDDFSCCYEGWCYSPKTTEEQRIDFYRECARRAFERYRDISPEERRRVDAERAVLVRRVVADITEGERRTQIESEFMRLVG